MTTPTQPTTEISREYTQEELSDLRQMDIITFLKRHTTLRRCPGCNQEVRLLNRRTYCDPCSYRIQNPPNAG